MIARRKVHPYLWIFLKLVITVAGFILLRQSGALSSAAIVKMATNQTAVAAMISVALTYDFIRGVSLFWILRQTGRPTPLWPCVKAQFIGYFFNFFLPGQAGGFGAKTIYVSRVLRVPLSTALSILSVELLMGFFALTAFTALNVAWLALRTVDPQLASWFWIYSGMALALTLGLPWLLRKARGRGWIPEANVNGVAWKDEVLRSVAWLDRWRLCVQVGSFAFVTFFMKCLVLWIAARQLEAPPEVTYTAICSSFALGVMVSLLPIAPGGLITGNLGFGSALALITGAPFATGADIYTAIWAVHALLGIAGGLIFISERGASDRAKDTPAPQSPKTDKS